MHPELQNLAEYARSLYRHGAVVAGSFLLTLALWGLGKWNPSFEQKEPYWLSPLLIGVGFVIANYLAWRDEWLKRGVQRPSLPKGLKLERQTVSHLEGHAPERTKFVLVADKDLRGKTIRLFCDGPIYHKGFIVKYTVSRSKFRMVAGSHTSTSRGITYNKGEFYDLTEKEAKKFGDRMEPIPGPAQNGTEYEPANLGEDILDDDTNTVVFDFSRERFSVRPFTVIIGEVGSVVPLRVTRVEWIKPRP